MGSIRMAILAVFREHQPDTKTTLMSHRRFQAIRAQHDETLIQLLGSVRPNFRLVH